MIGRSGGAGIIITVGIQCEVMTGKMGDVPFLKIGRRDNIFEWLVGIVKYEKKCTS